MNTEYKQKWVAALQSGKYEQGKYVLKNRNKFCCLGVLAKECDITKVSNVYIKPDSAQLIFGKEHNRIQTGLADLNDEGVPFEMIAGFIQENL